MSIYCICQINASGPDIALAEIKRLIDGHTYSDGDDERTNLVEIVGGNAEEYCPRRFRPPNEEECIWMGECYPPVGFVLAMSGRFPDATFELRIDAEDVGWIEVYEFKEGTQRAHYGNELDESNGLVTKPLRNCCCEIHATGPNDDVVRVRRLLDDNTDDADGERVTYFARIVDQELQQSWGWRDESVVTNEGVVWRGDLSGLPPDKFVEGISKMFPSVTFEMKFTVDDGPGMFEVFEFKDGSSRLTYAFDGEFEFCGQDTTPVDHYRVSLEFDSEADKEAVMTALRAEGMLSDGDFGMISQHTVESVLNWIESRFPAVGVRASYWRPFRRLQGRPAHQFATGVFDTEEFDERWSLGQNEDHNTVVQADDFRLIPEFDDTERDRHNWNLEGF